MQARANLDLKKVRKQLESIRGGKTEVASRLGCSLIWVHRVVSGTVSGKATLPVLEAVIDFLAEKQKEQMQEESRIEELMAKAQAVLG